MIGLVVHYGAELALGTSLLLLLGLVGARFPRSPVQRHGWAEGLLWSLPICMGCLLVPMQRPLAMGPWGESTVIAEALAPTGPPPSTGTASAQVLRLSDAPSSPSAPVLAIAFVAGAVLVLAYIAFGTALLARLLLGARMLPAMTRPGQGRVVVAGGARRPFCVGAGTWGLIVLPPTLIEPDRAGQLDAVLAHERAHLQGGHGRARLLAAALSPLFYWNPLFWLLVARMRADAELCADDAAATTIGKRRYVGALVDLVDEGPQHPHPTLPLMGVLSPARPFLQRMESLMLRSQPIDQSNSPARRTVSLALVGVAVVLVNAACGTTSLAPSTAIKERTAVSFTTLSLEGTEIGDALESRSKTQAPFPKRVEALDGQSIAIEGYVIPLAYEGDQVTEFILLRDNLQCCMGGAPTWGHWILGIAGEGAMERVEPGQLLRVEGDFDVVHPSDWKDPEYNLGVYELRDWNMSPVE